MDLSSGKSDTVSNTHTQCGGGGGGGGRQQKKWRSEFSIISHIYVEQRHNEIHYK